MHKKGNNYYYVARVDGKNKWTALGNDLVTARLEWAKLENVAFNAGDLVTFDVAAQRFEFEVIPHLGSRTQLEYTRQLKKLRAVFGNVPLDAITPYFINKYVRERTKKIAANREKALFSTVFNHARVWGYTSAPNPCAGVKGNKETGRDRYIEDDEFCRVMEQACQPLRVTMELAYYTGQRPSDVLKILRSDIKDGALWIRQNKTRTPIRIELEGPLLDIIIRITTEMPPLRPGTMRTKHLIQNEHGQAVTYGSLKYRFAKAREKSGVENIQFRDIRAKSATDTDDRSTISHAQDLLGHKSRKMTEHYIKTRIGKRVSPAPKIMKNRSNTRTTT